MRLPCRNNRHGGNSRVAPSINVFELYSVEIVGGSRINIDRSVVVRRRSRVLQGRCSPTASFLCFSDPRD